LLEKDNEMKLFCASSDILKSEIAFVGSKLIVRAEITGGLRVSMRCVTQQSPVFIKQGLDRNIRRLCLHRQSRVCFTVRNLHKYRQMNA
jgi:hypothetical protein